MPLEKSRSPATVNKVSKPRHNSRTKLRIQISHVQNRDNVVFYLHCKFQSSPFSVRCKNSVTDRQTDRTRHQRCRCLGGTFVTHSKLQLFYQSNSYAIRSQSVLTTIQLGVSTTYSIHSTRILNKSEIASGPALLSCSKILTYQLLGSQLWTALPLEKSRSPATVNKVIKSRHSSGTKLRVKLSHDQNQDNIEFYLHC